MASWWSPCYSQIKPRMRTEYAPPGLTRHRVPRYFCRIVPVAVTPPLVLGASVRGLLLGSPSERSQAPPTPASMRPVRELAVLHRVLGRRSAHVSGPTEALRVRVHPAGRAEPPAPSSSRRRCGDPTPATQPAFGNHPGSLSCISTSCLFLVGSY